MAETSGPRANGTTAERQMTDVLWRRALGRQAAIVDDRDGTAYALTLPADSDIAQVGSTTQDSLSVVAGFSHRVPQSDPQGVTIAAPTSAARTDVIVVRHDPAYVDAPGPCRLVAVAGSEGGGTPAVDQQPPGVEDLPLWAVTRSPGQSLSQASVVSMRRWASRTLLVDTPTALPTAPLGTFAHLTNGTTYQRRLSGGVASWVREAFLPYRRDLTKTGVAPNTQTGLGNAPSDGTYVGATNGVSVPAHGIYDASLTVNFGTGLAGRSFVQIGIDNSSAEANIARGAVLVGERLGSVSFGPVEMSTGQWFSGHVQHGLSGSTLTVRAYWRIARIA